MIRDYYPPIKPFDEGRLQVSELHNLYYEQVGNPSGVPIVFLHGGPGGGINPDHRRFFDPSHYRIILFDQRGSGKSTPSAELRDNTTWDLVADIERLREKLEIKRWLIFGGSWGSTLALSYAITHPEKTLALILRGIFLCRKEEIQWFYQKGASALFPDYWQEYEDLIPLNERNDFVSAYHRRLTHPDLNTRLTAARAWSKWEAATSRLIVQQSSIEEFEEPQLALAFARIECHFFMNNAFFKTDNYLLENISRIREIPGVIVQGRYDVVCPMKSAWDLHLAWPQADLKIIADAGHAAGESGIRSALVQATDSFRKIAP
jgi:proline iminopeptidase